MARIGRGFVPTHVEEMCVSQTYTAVIKQSGAWWIGWIEELPGINCQEPTREDLLETLKVTLLEALELNRREAKT
jgi:predicted RNase H-like HicB family nuclease